MGNKNSGLSSRQMNVESTQDYAHLESILDIFLQQHITQNTYWPKQLFMYFTVLWVHSSFCAQLGCSSGLMWNLCVDAQLQVKPGTCLGEWVEMTKPHAS